ncbi:MAG: VOC family protein [Terrimonas sp.]|nr:VOC family protein [Terrimonas sp.]
MQLKKIVPHLWYDTEAKEAAEFYVSIFPGSKINKITTIHDTPSGDCDIVRFELSGNPFMAISAGPEFKFNESISFIVSCDTQDEIDYYTEKLTANGGEQGPCGWVKDKFGLSWQVDASALQQMLEDGTEEQKNRVTNAFLKMKKLDLSAIEKAYKG